MVVQGRAHDYRGTGAKIRKSLIHVNYLNFSVLNNTICRFINVKLINTVLIESQLISCVSCVAVSDMQSVAAGEKYSRWGCVCQKFTVTIPIKEPKPK